MTPSEPDRDAAYEAQVAGREARWAEEDAIDQRIWNTRLLELRREREQRRVEENDEWKVSRERKIFLRVRYSTVAVACLFLFGLYLIANAGQSTLAWSWNLSSTEWLTLIWVAEFLVLTLAAVVMIAKYTTARHTFLARYRLDKKQHELAKREMNLAHLDLETLWGLTQKRLDLYHEIATGQAERSYRNSRIAISLGFIILTFAVILSAVSSTAGGAFAAAAAGVAGGVLAGYLSKTFLRTNESSTKQLRSYFEQPLTFSRYLAAERLLAGLQNEDRAVAIRDLIQEMAKPRTADASHTSEERIESG